MTTSWDDLPLQLTVEEAADVLRVNRNQVYKLVRQRMIPHIRLGRLVRIPRDEIRYWQHPDAAHPQTAVAARTSRPKVEVMPVRGGLPATGTHGRG
ncbi:MAG: DNA-binding protein [Bacillota bacterium]|jgi:excisionase family DNA binding protein|nr:MAG: DNA-binding protein [Bacillota bacterium]